MFEELYQDWKIHDLQIIDASVTKEVYDACVGVIRELSLIRSERFSLVDDSYNKLEHSDGDASFESWYAENKNAKLKSWSFEWVLQDGNVYISFALYNFSIGCLSKNSEKCSDIIDLLSRATRSIVRKYVRSKNAVLVLDITDILEEQLDASKGNSQLIEKTTNKVNWAIIIAAFALVVNVLSNIDKIIANVKMLLGL